VRESDTKLQYANEALWEAEAEIKKLREQVATLTADLYERDLALREEGMVAESMEKEAEIAVAKAEEWEQALERAANYIADTTGACPLEFDLEVDFETCTEDCKTNSADCWKQYFAKGAGA